MSKIHALIVAPPGTGKSTLISRVLEELNRPVFGYITRKEKDEWDEELGHPIYIYPAERDRGRFPVLLVGYCKDKRPTIYPEAFDRFAPHLWEPVPTNALILMDEIGFMETSSEHFCEGIFRLLDGETPVIAAVKDKDTEFLQKVRNHPKARCYYLTAENRDILFSQVLQHLTQEKE